MNFLQLTDTLLPSTLSKRDQLVFIEDFLLQFPQVELKSTLKHYFADGLYARELHIPKGTIMTGAIHKKAQINIVTKGSMTVTTDAGVKLIKAPCTILAKPGNKRFGYAHEDTVWTTIIATDKQTVEEVERCHIAPSFEDYDNFVNRLKIERTE